MDKDFFQFKSFRLRNRDSALKINSDGVLLAAWAKPSSFDRVLDIGTGGGVIAFILKHRFPNLKVHGLDIDGPSIAEANYNLSINSYDNLSFQQTSIQDYSKSYARNTYDHIISNPPFHIENLSAIDRLSIAKHTEELNFKELLKASQSLLSFVGKFSLIVPYELEEEIDSLAEKIGLFKTRIAHVKGKEGGVVKRSLIEYCKRPTGKIDASQFSIRNEDEELGYGRTYQNLTKDLYLNF